MAIRAEIFGQQVALGGIMVGSLSVGILGINSFLHFTYPSSQGFPAFVKNGMIYPLRAGIAVTGIGLMINGAARVGSTSYRVPMEDKNSKARYAEASLDNFGRIVIGGSLIGIGITEGRLLANILNTAHPALTIGAIGSIPVLIAAIMVAQRTLATDYLIDKSDVGFIKLRTSKENGLPIEAGGDWNTFNAWNTTYPYPD